MNIQPTHVPLPDPQSAEARDLQPNRRQRRAITALFHAHQTRQRLALQRKILRKLAVLLDAQFGPHETLKRAMVTRLTMAEFAARRNSAA